MKKILLWGIIFASFFFCLNVKAEEISKFTKLSNAARDLYSWAGLYASSGEQKNYYFSEGEVVDPFVVWQYMAYTNDVYFKDYVEYTMFEEPTTGESYPLSGKFSVPAELFEDVLLNTFDVDMNYIETNIRKECQIMLSVNCGYTKVGEDYFYNYELGYGFGTGTDLVDLPLGFKDLGNDTYEVYSYLGSYCDNHADLENNPTAECENFKPSVNDVYGEDYIVDVFQYKDEEGNEVVESQALKIIGYIKVKLNLNGEYVKFISIEEVPKDNLVSKSELVKEDTPSVVTKNDEVAVTAEKGVFVNGTKISVDKITEGTMYEVVTKALVEKTSNFIVYDINAKAGEYAVQPNGKVKISIKVPEFYKNASIYYVSTDGKLEKMDTKIESGYAIAELEHFSTYVLVEEEIANKVEDEVENKVEENVVENPNTSAFHKLDVILASVLIIGTLVYTRFKKVNKYNHV